MLDKLMKRAEDDEKTEQALNKAFSTADSGQMASRAVSLVVALTVGGLVAAFLLPIAVDELVGVDTSSWSSGASSLWDIMDVIVILALFLFFISMATASQIRG